MRHEIITCIISVDIDECDADPPVCDPAKATACINTDGDYRCRCKSGYDLTVGGHSCEGKHTAAACIKFSLQSIVKRGTFLLKCFINQQLHGKVLLSSLFCIIQWRLSI